MASGTITLKTAGEPDPTQLIFSLFKIIDQTRFCNQRTNTAQDKDKSAMKGIILLGPWHPFVSGLHLPWAKQMMLCMTSQWFIIHFRPWWGQASERSWSSVPGRFNPLWNLLKDGSGLAVHFIYIEQACTQMAFARLLHGKSFVGNDASFIFGW